MSSTSITTLGALIDERYRLYVCCEAGAGGTRCNHDALVDLVALAERLGRDHGCLAADLTEKFRCGRCGSRDTSIRLHPPTVRDINTGRLG